MEIVVVIESLDPTLNDTGCVERYDANFRRHHG